MKLRHYTPVAASLLLALGFSAQAADNHRYIIQVDNDKKGLIKALSVRMGGKIELDSNGFIAATFDGKSLDQVRGLLNNPHIKLIEVDQRRYPMSLYQDDAGNPNTQQLTPYAVYQSQANLVDLQLNNAKKVCVIDSGIARETGETGGYNPDFVWSRITGDSNSGTGDWFRDGGPHGTHVAGTIAAADNTFGVIGMAPGNPLHIIKVFNDSGWGYSSSLAHAANLCAAAGSKIINMSLGGGGASSTEENAFNTFTANGGLVLAAAGNSGNTTRSYPAGYKSVMMVGANDANNQIADFSQHPGCTITSGRGNNRTTETHDGFCVEVTAGGVDTLSTYPAGGATLASLSMDNTGFAASAMENQGSANGQTYYMGLATATDAGAAGKVCTIDRGQISFYDKVRNCELSGGIGAIIINNEPGMLYGTLGTSNNTSIPAVGATYEDRSSIIAAGTASISVGAADYGYMSGTSMATPAVAGVAALVWSNHPQCTGTEIREALKATAEDAGAPGKDVYFGYGIVKALEAHQYLATFGCAGGDNGGGDDGDNGGGDDGDNGGDNGGDDGNSIQLDAFTYKVSGRVRTDLSWSGASSSQMDIFRNNSKVATVNNSGSYTDVTNIRGGGSLTYRICEAGTNTCSDSVTVNY
ncbi:S8 family serine peptidase [Alkalimonas amylolytica]|uniref:PA domain-containing protein n=1 Tax=Alkalimonas amylolytica TaxID=152573 RepID=A0A1H4CP24_ALKAM|nr:S8 family serine peptidase [Alkalimonas amylolytica]SEA62107.1 PA domain-containing protein [Alkalimonas amylolytica]